MSRYSTLAVAVVATALTFPTNVLASGGTSVANAPTLSYGHLEAGGGVKSEFWRLPVSAGDLVTFDIDAQPIGYENLDFRLRPPSVTDYTLHQDIGDGLGPIGQGKQEVNWQAPFSGNAVLWVTTWRDSPEVMGSYTFTATVTHATTLTISAPSLTHQGSLITVRASVESPAGTPEGTCLIQGQEAALSGGQCSVQLRLSARGSRQVLRASFVPSDGWKAASAVRSIRLLPSHSSHHQGRRHHRQRSRNIRGHRR